MYSNKVRNLAVPENLFSNLGVMKSTSLSETDFSSTTPNHSQNNMSSYPEFPTIPTLEKPTTSAKDYNPAPSVTQPLKLTKYSNRKEYRSRIDKMYEELKDIIPIDSEIDSVLYFNNYVEKGIVVKPKVQSLKQTWTEFRLISNEKPQITTPPVELKVETNEHSKESDTFERLFEALSTRVSEINTYIDELKKIKTSIDKTTKKLESDKAKLANEKSEFNSYKQREETKLNKEKETLKINFNRLQTIIDDLDKKLVSIDIEE